MRRAFVAATSQRCRSDVGATSQRCRNDVADDNAPLGIAPLGHRREGLGLPRFLVQELMLSLQDTHDHWTALIHEN